jgi:hypothetical protein
MGLVKFTTKDGKTVSFYAKGNKKTGVRAGFIKRGKIQGRVKRIRNTRLQRNIKKLKYKKFGGISMAKRKQRRRRRSNSFGGITLKKVLKGGVAGLVLGSGLAGIGAGYYLGGVGGALGAVVGTPILANLLQGSGIATTLTTIKGDVQKVYG